MEVPCRRGRRGRCHSHHTMHSQNLHTFTPPTKKSFSFLSFIYSCTVMASLIALVYMMLDYNCMNCTSKYDFTHISKNIEDIAQNIAVMKENYFELETKITKFSQELPKIEGQIEILEALANTIENSHFGWDPKSHLCLPNVDVFLNKCSGDHNVTSRCPSKCHKSFKVQHHHHEY